MILPAAIDTVGIRQASKNKHCSFPGRPVALAPGVSLLIDFNSRVVLHLHVRSAYALSVN